MLKTKLSFIVTIVALIGLLLLAYFKGTNTTMEIVSIVGIYVLGRSATSISHGWASSKDPNADTNSVISKLEEKD